jgi:hypothetical protein
MKVVKCWIRSFSYVCIAVLAVLPLLSLYFAKLHNINVVRTVLKEVSRILG